ncbi:hypothetical protein Tco_1433903 [Tanacetum coccineum]
MEDGIFFNQSKYIKEMLKKFGLEDSKPMKTPMSSDTKLTKDEECESVDSTKYRGMIGDYVDRKSTSGICTFVGCCLTSWFSKKQTALAISTTKAEYVSAGKACQQALWMKQALIDYDVWKRISDKRTKNQAKTDKTEHGMEEQSKPKSTPTKSKVKVKAETEEMLNGPTRTHLMGQVNPFKHYEDQMGPNTYYISSWPKIAFNHR